MKLKKFFAGVLAAAMMLTVGATSAFATTPDTISVKKDGSETDAKMFTESDDDLVLTKTLHVVKGTAPDSMTFSFTVVKQGETTAINGAASNAVFTATQDEPFVGPNKDYTATTTVQLATVLGNNKDKVGEYSYTITESTPAYPGVTPVDSTLTMKITVVNQLDEQKQPIANSYGYYVALYRDNKKVEAKDAFKNSYDSKSLTLSKTVHGALGDLSKPFTFKITFNKNHDITDASGLYKGPQLPTNLDGVTVSGKNGGDYLTIGEEYTVTMKHGQSLTFTNLPAGVEYVVKEDGSEAGADGVTLTCTNNAGNTVKYDVSVKNANGENVGFDSNKATVSGSISADVTTAFHNTNAAEPDMGVVLDNAPYIAMLAIVAIGGVALMLNKRRRDEE